MTLASGQSTVATLLDASYARLGEARTSFDCCDTRFTVQVRGRGAEAAAARGRERALDLERQLNAFDEASAVARLNREGRVENAHVAAVVRRGLEYADRTGGVFDVGQGAVEHALKAYLRGDAPDAPDAGAFVRDELGVRVDGTTVETDATLDLNGLAKGYVVDRTAESVAGIGRTGAVDGGGDIANPLDPVAVESPWGDGPLKVLATDWSVATSAGYRRTRGAVDHIYNPRDGRLGTAHDLVTVVARRDCTEADALATTLSALPVSEGLDLAETWGGVEALVVHGGVFHRTGGFGDHVASE